MSNRSPERLPRREITSGEIVVGLAWIVFYVALIASGWARDALMLLAERAPSGQF